MSGPAEGRATASWPIGSVRAASWGDDDERLPPAATSHTKLHAAQWLEEDEAGPTARRSVPPRTQLYSTPWETVQAEELLPLPAPRAQSSPRASESSPVSSLSPPTPPASSMGPVSIETGREARARRGESVDFGQSGTAGRGRLLAAAVVAGAALGVALYLGALPTRPPADPDRATAAAPPSPAQGTPALPAALAVKGIAEAKEPQAPAAPQPPKETGTVVGSPAHRLYVDGHLAASWKADVKCGPHTVKNGSHGALRTVTVPCGGEVEALP